MNVRTRKITYLVLSLIILLCIVLMLLNTFCTGSRSGRAGNPEQQRIYDSTQKYALIVGVKDYEDQDLTSLDYSESDARNLYETLTVYSEYPEDNVILLTSSASQSSGGYASKDNIISSMERLASKATDSDGVLLFYFSGHGVSVNNQNYLLSADAQFNDGSVTDTSVNVNNLVSLANQSPAQKIFFLDACRNELIEGGRSPLPNMDDSYYSGNSAVIVSSSREGHFSFESDEYQAGYMSYWLNKGLRGDADTDSSGYISFSELITCVDGGVKRFAREENKDQEISVKNEDVVDRDLLLGFSIRAWDAGDIGLGDIDPGSDELTLQRTASDEFGILSAPANMFEQKQVDSFNKCYDIFQDAESALESGDYEDAYEYYISTLAAVKETIYYDENEEDFMKLYEVSELKSCQSIFMQAEEALGGGEYEDALALYIRTKEELGSTVGYTSSENDNNDYTRLYNISDNKQTRIEEHLADEERINTMQTELAQVGEHYDAAREYYLDSADTLEQFVSARKELLEAIIVVRNSKYSSVEEYVRALGQLQDFLEEVDKWILAKSDEGTDIVHEVLGTDITYNKPWYINKRTEFSLTNLSVNMYTRDFENDFIHIPGGSFMMGSTDGGDDEEPPHNVSLSSYYMQKYEVTASEYAVFLNEKGNSSPEGKERVEVDSDYSNIYKDGNMYRAYSGRENHPVNEVSWFGARDYCEWIGGSLPSEAQWEFAAGNGERHTKWSLGDSCNASDYITGRSLLSTVPKANTEVVGSKRANDFGLYDMSGNVWEWCLDKYEDDWYSNTGSSGENPCNQCNNYTGNRVIRGGSWNGDSDGLRSANRNYDVPALRSSLIGFRCVSLP